MTEEMSKSTCELRRDDHNKGPESLFLFSLQLQTDSPLLWLFVISSALLIVINTGTP